MKVGIPAEIYPGELKVAAIPDTVARIIKLGLEVQVQAGAGDAARYVDADYVEAGASIVSDVATLWATSDIVLKVRQPTTNADRTVHEADLLKEGVTLISFIWPAQSKENLERIGKRKATVLAMDCVQRITRAQKMDALSAMANIAGYRAIIEAAGCFGRFMPGQITAAGRVIPAKVFVLGAGVAGLAAIAAARSLGAQVRAFDTRPAVREQVESLGAQFVEFRFDEAGEGAGGYAKEMSDAYLAAEQALIAQHAKECDIIVTTALIPGKPAPQLITSGAVGSMSPGSVIVDLAAEQGGNCALTEPGRIVEKSGVTIIGLTDLPSRMARQSSDLYATTVCNLLAEIVKDGRVQVDMDDEVVRGALVLHEGTLTWPPPIRPMPHAAEPRHEERTAEPGHGQREAAKPAAAPAAPNSARLTGVLAVLAIALLGIAGLLAPPDFLGHLTIFILACIVGWHLVWNVTPALHTPLMSVTNAISGIILVGGMLVMSGSALDTVTILGCIAVLVASVNVAGGFLVTQRMLRMFRK